MGSEVRDVTEQLADATTIMLGAPSMSQGTDGLCVDLLTPEGSGPVSVLWVTLTRSPEQCLESWRAERDTDPDDFGVIVVGDVPGTGGTDVDNQAVKTVSSPSDLTGIGITVGEFVSGRDEPITVCFDSLTALLQYVDLETAYEFLHALTGQLYSVGAVSHFHIDPNAHDRQTVDTLLSLFDAEVDLSGEDPSVRTRYPDE